MNEEHLALCSSPEWAAYVADDLLPWVLAGHQLGDELLEVGPGPGLTTDILRRHAGHVTAAELDADLAAAWPGGWPGPTWRWSPPTRRGCRSRTDGSRPWPA